MEGVGHYVTQEDFDYLAQMCLLGGSDAGRVLRNNISGLSTLIIISGADISTAGGNTSITDGWCLWGDEICRIPAATVATGAATWFAAVTENVGVAKVYQDGSSHYVNQERVVRLYSGAAAPGGSVVAGQQDYVDTGWKTITLNAAYTAMSGNPPQIRRRLKQVEFKGAIVKVSSATSAVAFSVSGATGPERIIGCVGMDTNHYTAACRISTSNEVSFKRVGTVNEANGDTFYLDGIRLTL